MTDENTTADAADAPRYPAPDTLGVDGERIWTLVTSKYALRPDELVVLEDYCLFADEITDLRAEWIDLGRPRMTKGSMGQLVVHPMPKQIAELRMKRATLARQLKLPDLDGGEQPVNQQRDAANSKWSQGRGRGAS